MDSFEWNKVAGAVLGTLIFVMVVGLVAETVYTVPEPAKPGYVVAGVKEESTAATPAKAEVAEAMPDFATAIPAADAANGAKIAQRCAQCHDWSKGGPNKIGPNLYGVVGRDRASHAGFDYSAGLKAMGGKWTYAELFKFLKQPQVYVSGTKMSFAGLSSEKDRLDVISYLRTLADSPEPLPPPAPAAAPADAAKPAGDAAKPAETPAKPK